MYNLTEYSSVFSKTIGSLLFYSKDEASNFSAYIANDDNFKSFKYKTNSLGNKVSQPAPNATNGVLRNATISVPLKYFRTLIDYL